MPLDAATGEIARDYAVRTGDTIEVSGFGGEVQEISFRTTQLRTAEGVVVDPPPTLELRGAAGGTAELEVTFWTKEPSGVSAAVAAVRARFPQGEVRSG